MGREQKVISEECKYSVSAAVLKNVSYITMFIDHFFAVIYYDYARLLPDEEKTQALFMYRAGRNIGRVSFVLFAFMLAEGIRHTRNRKRFLGVLFLFALLSEIPFDLALYREWFYAEAQNIYFTLFIGAAVVCLLEKFSKSGYLRFLVPVSGIVLAVVLRVDYMVMGIILIVSFYYLGNAKDLVQKLRLFGGTAIILFAGTVSNHIVRCTLRGDVFTESLLNAIILTSVREMFGLFAFVLIFLYNGKRGRQLPKYFYYILYPVHLLLYYFLYQRIM